MIRIYRTRPLVDLAMLCLLRCLAVVGAVLLYLLGLCMCSSEQAWLQFILGHGTKEEGQQDKGRPRP